MQEAIEKVSKFIIDNRSLWESSKPSILDPLKKAIEGDEDDVEEGLPPSDKSDMKTEIAMAKDALSKKEWSKTITITEKIISEHPNYAPALKFRGMAAYFTQDHKNSKTFLAKHQSIDYDPDIEPLLRESINVLSTKSDPLPQPPSPKTRPPKANTGSALENDFTRILNNPEFASTFSNILNNKDLVNSIQNSELFKNMEQNLRK